jgi:GST-like protein
MSIILYAAPMSSATPVVHAFAELEVPHEMIRVDLSSGALRKPEFLALNPNGRVPTIVVDGTPMFEALAIMQWLGDRFGVERRLWPAADAPQRLEALSWSTWAYVTFGSAMQRLHFATSDRLPAELHHRAQAEHARTDLQHSLGLLDTHLAERPWMLGESFSLVDVIVGSVVTYGTFCGVDVDDHPHVRAWLARFHARPAYQKSWSAHAA